MDLTVFLVKYWNYLKMTFPINYLKYLISPSPSILKPAKVIPVHKKDSKLDFSNYHPISLLSNTEKSLERLMYNWMYKFFSDNNLIYPFQFAFRQKYSTVHALISLTENIRKNLDKANIGCGNIDLNIMLYVVLLMNGSREHQ